MNGCFSEQEAREIANGDQGTDEDPNTLPGPGWHSKWWDPTQLVLPAGMLDKSDENMRQQGVNAFYHALHPGAQEGVGNSILWNNAMQGSGNTTALGQYLHYLQDTFSHSGYTSPKCGHGCADQHLPDHTIADVPKANRMAGATWKALGDYARQKMCCQPNKWNPRWSGMIDAFNGIGYGTDLVLRASEGSDYNLNTKRIILNVPMRYPGRLK